MPEHDYSKVFIGFLADIALFDLFVVGYDQGHIFSIAQGNEAFDAKYLHEIAHDMRHMLPVFRVINN